MFKRKKKEDSSIIPYAVSSVFHVILLFIAYYFANVNISKINPASEYVQVTTAKRDVETVDFNKIKKKTIETKSDKRLKEPTAEKKKQVNIQSSALVNPLDQKADTSSLQQIYSEPTLNVSIKYPNGWTFLDQDVNKKLDGVTFWANSSNYNPPPYVHLQVCDKMLFNENRYKHKLILKDAVMFFNDPENLANYFSQVFFFRTETDEDYSLKLTIKGEDAFNDYVPTFYGMLKTFRFGSAFF